MRVAIAQADGKWPNLALAKLCAWHRAQGDTVEWFMALDRYDRVYASKVFTDTPHDFYLPNDAERGGTGYGNATKARVLPDEVESTRPDFSPWPRWRKSMGFSTRGCVRRCAFCVVPAKEGQFRVVADFSDLWDGKSSELLLLDGNATAAPIEHFRDMCIASKIHDVEIEFNQGLDCRLFARSHAHWLALAVTKRYIHFAFDSLAVEGAVRRTVKLCQSEGIAPRRLMFLTLVGFDSTPEEDTYRIDLLRSLGVNPFVMPFNRRDRYQKDLARWCNSVVARQSCTFAEYQKVAP